MMRDGIQYLCKRKILIYMNFHLLILHTIIQEIIEYCMFVLFNIFLYFLSILLFKQFIFTLFSNIYFNNIIEFKYFIFNYKSFIL